MYDSAVRGIKRNLACHVHHEADDNEPCWQCAHLNLVDALYLNGVLE